MKWMIAPLLTLGLLACSNGEVDTLRQENARLKMQLETITRERDDLRTQVDSVRAALGQPPSSTDSGSAGSSDTGSGTDSSGTGSSDTGSSDTGSSDMGAGTAGPSGSTTEPPTSGTTPSEGSGTTSSGSGQASSEAVTLYAQEVIKAAAAYATSTGSTAPEDCTNGYEAGSSKLALGSGISLKSCKIVNEAGQLHVELEAMDGSTAKVSSTGP